MAAFQCIDWLFGRGLSIGCGLPWVVPPKWQGLPREVKIERIKAALRYEMDQSYVDCQIIRELLTLLEHHTMPG